jgi:hypothetical protein
VSATLQINQIENLLFEKTLLAFHKLLPSYRVAQWQAGVRLRELPDLADSFAAQLHAWFLNGHRVDVMTETDRIEVPATPWEFFKQKYAPKWFLRRWPVKMETKEFRVAIHHHYVCPHIDVPSDKGNHVHYAWMGEQSGQIPPRYPV